MGRKKGPKKAKWLQLTEFALAKLLVALTHALPFPALHRMGALLGGLTYRVAARRRRIALDNLQQAYREEKTAAELERIARASFQAAFLTFLEIIKFQHRLHHPQRMLQLASDPEGIERLLTRVKQVHEESGGCIFVTPHLGNWEVLPHACAHFGVPLVVVARPLDNPYLEALFFSQRAASGQMLIAKRNALFMLQKTLHKGKSIGLLADQATRGAIAVDYFGRKATTTPVPAILATSYQRPIVVVACCRAPDGSGFEGFMAEPIWPGEYQSEKAEIFRLTEATNQAMESIIRKRPEQYLWMHDRWKEYRSDKRLGLAG